MHYFNEKIKRRLAQIEQSIYTKSSPITHYRVCEGKTAGCEAPDFDDSGWRSFTTDEFWGGYDGYQWFRTILEIPADFAGRPVAFVLNTEYEDNVSSLRTAEYTAYVDGELNQGLDAFHQELILTNNAKGGERYSLALMGFSGLTPSKSLTTTKIVAIDPTTRDYYYNLRCALECMEVIDHNSAEYYDIMRIVNDSMKLVDFLGFLSDNYYASIAAANSYLHSNLYEAMSSASGIVVDAIGHAHIDVAWLWQLSHTIEKCGRTFATADKFMDAYPDYKFIQSQPQLYAYTKEAYPKLYEKIKKRIAEGRWQAEGGMWVEADCNLISGESMIRQFLLGKAFFMDEFGIDNKILWLPDVFGYSAAMPQILAKCGIPYFMTTKISWNQFNDIPMDTFYLKGIDGTRVLTHFVTTPDVRNPNYSYNQVLIYKKTYNGHLSPWPVMQAWKGYKQKGINNEIMVSFGHGDGGGGPTTEMLEMAKRLKNFPGMPKVRQIFADEFFENLEKNLEGKDVPEWWGELYLEYHRGTYTSQAKNKKYNRQGEFLLTNAETFCTFDMLLGGDHYPQIQLTKAWKTLLLNQFHDIIPGSSIAAVYEDSDRQYAQLLTDGKDMLKTAADNICSKIDASRGGIAVFNPTSNCTGGLVSMEGVVDIQSVETTCGKHLPVQHSINGEMVFYAIDMPQKGYKLFYPSTSKANVKNAISVSKSFIESPFYRIKLDSDCNITSIFDKQNNREVLAGRANVLQAFEDKPLNFDAWDIDIFYTEKMWEVNDVAEASVICQGPVYGILRIVRNFRKSVITQDIVVYKDSPVIDFRTEIDWKEQEILLKAAFPVDINSTRATYEIQYGSIERPTHANTSWDVARFEVCAHKWVDLSEGDYGVSLLNDCKYGHDIRGNQMRITLLKSAVYPDPNADKGQHSFTYSLYPHKGDWQHAKTIGHAYALNNPFFVQAIAPQNGLLPHEFSLISVDCENIVIEAVKKAENEDAIIIRLYECHNTRGNAVVKFGFPIAKAWECDMLEQNIKEMDAGDQTIEFDFTPYEIKTLKIYIA